MPTSAAEVFREWHDFYVVIGTAAATLVGLMFVVASIGNGFLTQERAAATRAFFSPLVVHFAGVLIGCALTLVPALPSEWFAILFGIGSVIGLIYSTTVWLDVRPHEVEFSDRIWYAAMPWLSYAIVLAAAVLIYLQRPIAFDIMPAALVMLLLICIRNAWDLTLFIVRRNAASPSEGGPPAGGAP